MFCDVIGNCVMLLERRKKLQKDMYCLELRTKLLDCIACLTETAWQKPYSYWCYLWNKILFAEWCTAHTALWERSLWDAREVEETSFQITDS